MEIGSDSDSDASHISATPPRNPNPPSHSSSAAGGLPPLPKSKPIPKPKPFPRSKPKPKSKPSPTPSDPPSPAPFPSIDLSNPHGLSVIKVHRTADRPEPDRSASSFSRLVKSRRPSFDPSEFEAGAKIASCDEIPTGPAEAVAGAKDAAKPKRVHPNWIGFHPQPELPKRPKFSKEGNFVRLNINGYGRKYGYKNSKRRFSASSCRRRFRRRLGKRNSENEVGDGIWEEDGLVVNAEWAQSKCSNCGGNRLVEEAVLAAREDPSDDNLKKLLKLTHGYDSFREGQLEVIKSVVAGGSTMLVLPTGAGKSLCYELSAMILPGVTLVVSPLVALMIDQLKKLPSVIPGGLLSSNQTSEEASETLERLHEGNLKVLFVSPERFLNTKFLSTLGDGLSISLVVIDEAHCISEWSHNFRPSYLRLRASVLQTKLSVRCVLAMTATATTQTLHDIMNALEIPPGNLIRTSYLRENLQLFVSMSENRLKDLLMLMKGSPFVDVKSIIIYCKFQAETDLVSKYLCDNNIPAKSYHSGIPAKYRSRIQELFCSNKIRVVVATVAFGMGLDKSDVQAVIHYSLPESLEEYIQETGRAGRNGRIAYCHLLLDVTTYYKLRSLSYSDGVDEYAVSKLLSDIFSSDVGNICSLVKESVSSKFDMKEEVILTILTQLEVDEQFILLLPQLNVTCSLNFHKTDPTLLSGRDVLVASALKKSEIKDGHYVFDIPTVANGIGMEVHDVLNHLQNLKSLGEITYDLKDLAFCFMIVKKPDNLCSLSAKLAEKLSQVESFKVKKLDTMFNIASAAAKDCKRLRKLDAMFNIANSAAKDCKRVDGCSSSLHTPCIERKISEYFCGKHEMLDDELSFKMAKNSRFLRADIKVFLQSNSYAKFTPRAIARIMHGIASPAFPSSTWSKSHFWGRYVEIDFPSVMEAAKLELMNFVSQNGDRVYQSLIALFEASSILEGYIGERKSHVILSWTINVSLLRTDLSTSTRL